MGRQLSQSRCSSWWPCREASCWWIAGCVGVPVIQSLGMQCHHFPNGFPRLPDEVELSSLQPFSKSVILQAVRQLLDCNVASEGAARYTACSRQSPLQCGLKSHSKCPTGALACHAKVWPDPTCPGAWCPNYRRGCFRGLGPADLLTTWMLTTGALSANLDYCTRNRNRRNASLTCRPGPQEARMPWWRIF